MLIFKYLKNLFQSKIDSNTFLFGTFLLFLLGFLLTFVFLTLNFLIGFNSVLIYLIVCVVFSFYFYTLHFRRLNDLNKPILKTFLLLLIPFYNFTVIHNLYYMKGDSEYKKHSIISLLRATFGIV